MFVLVHHPQGRVNLCLKDFVFECFKLHIFEIISNGWFWINYIFTLTFVFFCSSSYCKSWTRPFLEEHQCRLEDQNTLLLNLLERVDVVTSAFFLSDCTTWIQRHFSSREAFNKAEIRRKRHLLLEQESEIWLLTELPTLAISSLLEFSKLNKSYKAKGIKILEVYYIRTKDPLGWRHN